MRGRRCRDWDGWRIDARRWRYGRWPWGFRIQGVQEWWYGTHEVGRWALRIRGVQQWWFRAHGVRRCRSRPPEVVDHVDDRRLHDLRAGRPGATIRNLTGDDDPRDTVDEFDDAPARPVIRHADPLGEGQRHVVLRRLRDHESELAEVHTEVLVGRVRREQPLDRDASPVDGAGHVYEQVATDGHIQPVLRLVDFRHKGKNQFTDVLRCEGRQLLALVPIEQ